VLALENIAPQFEAMGIATGQRTVRRGDDTPLFRRFLDSGWQLLPDAIRELHSGTGTGRFSGSASVEQGISALSRSIGRMAGFPAEASGIPVTVRIEYRKGKERWFRDFDGHRFTSTYSLGRRWFDGLICERFGPVKVGMALVPKDGQLRYITRRWSLLGLPMPGFLLPKGQMYEAEIDGRFNFHVEIRLPLIGLLVAYKGWLAPES